MAREHQAPEVEMIIELVDQVDMLDKERLSRWVLQEICIR